MATASCQNKTWTVVAFLEECTVEAVPTSWIFGDLCYFPTATKEKITSAIAKNDPVDLNWPKHKVRTFINGTYESYHVARQKARVAEDTSDLNSECEELTKKRKRKKIVFSSSGSDSDSDKVAEKLPNKLPPPPKLITPNVVKPSISGTKFNRAAMVRDDDQVDSDRILHYEIEDGEHYGSNLSQIDGGPSINQTQYNPQGQTEEVIICNNLCNKCCNQSEKIWDGRARNIATQCHIIRNMVTDIYSEIKEMKNNSNQARSAIDEGPQVTFYETLDLNFPLDNLEDLTKFEDFLNNNESFELAAKDIARCGGNNSYEFIKRSMTPLISNKLAQKFNWEGKKKKQKFSQLNVAKLIIEADKKGKISATQKECEKSIVAWLKRAKEREERITKKF